MHYSVKQNFVLFVIITNKGEKLGDFEKIQCPFLRIIIRTNYKKLYGENMYDTIAFRVYIEKPEELFKRIGNGYPIINPKTGEIIGIKGKFKNMQWSLLGNTLSVRNSLARYYFGNNIETFDINTTKAAVNMLCEEFGIKPEEANVYQIHFAENLNMMHECHNYLDCLDSLERFKKVTYYSTVQFTTTNRALSFYDKVEEQKSNRRKADRQEIIGNLLRYEMKINGRLKKQLGLEGREISLVTLTEEWFFTSLVRMWYTEFQKIKKVNREFQMTNYLASDARELTNNLAAIALQKFFYVGGVVEAIKREKAKNRITPRQSESLVKKVLSLNEMHLKEVTDPYCAELEDKIRNVALHYHS
jgi:hypothetical protein